MRTIRVEMSGSEASAYKWTFTAEGGKPFSDDDLAAVRVATNGLGMFNGRSASKISVSYTMRTSGRPQHAAFRVLRQRYPRVRFATYANGVKEAFGDQIKLIRHQPHS